MKTFTEALLKFRDCTDAERDAFSGIVKEAAMSPDVHAMLLALCLLGPNAMMGAFTTGLMIGIEMEKRDEGVAV